MALRESDLERYGVSVSPDPPLDPRAWTNKRTGEIVQVPRGIDPGFAHNPGTLAPATVVRSLYRDRVAAAPARIVQAVEGLPRLRNAAIRQLDDLPADDARRRVRGQIGTDEFRDHVAGRTEGDLPIAVLASSAAAALGSTARTVRLSQETAAKQLFRHSDLSALDYARVQHAFDEGEVFHVGSTLVGYLQEDDRLWAAVVKVTRLGELYLVSFSRAKPRDLRAAGRRHPPLI